MTHQSWINAYETQIQIQTDQTIFVGLIEKIIQKFKIFGFYLKFFS